MENKKTYKDGEIAICGDCGKEFVFLEWETTFYKDKPLCFDCYDTKYGYCNECGKLNLYSDMNDDIVCEGCENV